MKFDDMMAELRKEYLASFPQKFKLIEDHLASGNIEFLRDDFHKLKGTGKTYGMPEVSELAATVEQLCKTKPQDSLTFAPLGLTILKKIYKAHTTQAGYNLSADEDYKKILTFT